MQFNDFINQINQTSYVKKLYELVWYDVVYRFLWCIDFYFFLTPLVSIILCIFPMIVRRCLVYDMIGLIVL